MMDKEFCTDKQSLALKELGFDEPCFGYYVDGELRGVNLGIEELGGVKPYYERFGYHTINNHHIDNKNKIITTAPLKQQAFKFFREKYSLQHEIYYMDDLIMNGYVITDTSTNTELTEFIFKDNYFEFKGYTYEEAETTCLDKLIEIVKTK